MKIKPSDLKTEARKYAKEVSENVEDEGFGNTEDIAEDGFIAGARYVLKLVDELAKKGQRE